jgi:hypothetical protein
MTPAQPPEQSAVALSRRRPVAAAVLVTLISSAACLALAPALLPASYSVTEHAISESAAQGLEGAWLARLGFVLFGFAVLASASIAGDRWGLWGGLFHRLFGAAMIGVAAFSHRPWEDDLPFDEVEDNLHSVMSSVVGVAFTAGVLIVMLRRGPTARWGRVFDGTAIVAATVIPMIMLNASGIAGLVQRVMFAVAYLWHGEEAISSLLAKAPNAGGGTGRGPRWTPMTRTKRRDRPDAAPTSERVPSELRVPARTPQRDPDRE